MNAIQINTMEQAKQVVGLMMDDFALNFLDTIYNDNEECSRIFVFKTGRDFYISLQSKSTCTDYELKTEKEVADMLFLGRHGFNLFHFLYDGRKKDVISFTGAK